eukprot:6207182-Pleurochrysis_carterae.AAC.2
MPHLKSDHRAHIVHLLLTNITDGTICAPRRKPSVALLPFFSETLATPSTSNEALASKSHGSLRVLSHKAAAASSLTYRAALVTMHRKPRATKAELLPPALIRLQLRIRENVIAMEEPKISVARAFADSFLPQDCFRFVCKDCPHHLYMCHAVSRLSSDVLLWPHFAEELASRTHLRMRTQTKEGRLYKAIGLPEPWRCKLLGAMLARADASSHSLLVRICVVTFAFTCSCLYLPTQGSVC